MKRFLEWVEYPTSQAAIVAALALVGIELQPEYLKEIIEGAAALITLIFGYKSDVDVANKEKK